MELQNTRSLQAAQSPWSGGLAQTSDARIAVKLEREAAQVARRLLPCEPADSRLFHDLQRLTLEMLRELHKPGNG